MELLEKARRMFGDDRAEELQADLAKLASDLEAIRQYSVSINDEP